MLTLPPAGDFAAALHHLLAAILGPAPNVFRALETARERVWLAFAFANGPLVLRSATIYTEDEFDRTLAGGQGWLGGR